MKWSHHTCANGYEPHLGVIFEAVRLIINNTMANYGIGVKYNIGQRLRINIDCKQPIEIYAMPATLNGSNAFYYAGFGNYKNITFNMSDADEINRFEEWLINRRDQHQVATVKRNWELSISTILQSIHIKNKLQKFPILQVDDYTLHKSKYFKSPIDYKVAVIQTNNEKTFETIKNFGDANYKFYMYDQRSGKYFLMSMFPFK